MSELPYIVAVDDDPDVLKAVGRDLRKRYRPKYRVLTLESPAEALQTILEMERRGRAVALFLVDQRMPDMLGVDFLAEALKVYPEARRALLTAYSETDTAIRAINEVRLDYFLTKPWDPPETKLYPVLDDLLDDWRETWRPVFQGWRVFGNRWSPASHDLTEFLSRNQIPYQWTDVESKNPDDLQLLASVPDGLSQLPVVLTPDGDVLRAPTIGEVADRIGMSTSPRQEFYDLIIVGGGPAGLAAAVYGASEGLKTVLVESEAPGGQAGTSSRIENYLGFPSGLTGADLARRAVAQAARFGVEILKPRLASKLSVEGPYRVVTLDDGTRLVSHAVLISTGLSWRRLDVPGVERLQGAGVYYGASMGEALNCRDEEVFMIGGANSAGQAAMHFSRYARKVTMLVRGDSLAKSMSQYLIDQIAKTANIDVRVNAQVVAVEGKDHLELLRIRCEAEESECACAGLYVFIGAQPRTEWLRDVLPVDDLGYVLSGADLPRITDSARRRKGVAGWTEERDPYPFETVVPGVFVAGDVRQGSVKRVASAVGEGSVVVMLVHQYLSKVRQAGGV